MSRSTLYLRALTVLLLASVHSPAFSAAPLPVTGYFLDVPALLANRSETTSPLLSGVKTPRLEPREALGTYHVSSAMLVDQQDKPGGFIVVVNADDGSFTALVNTGARSGVVTGKTDGTQVFREEPTTAGQVDDFVTDPGVEPKRRPASEENPVPLNEQYVLTVLAGFSEEAAAQVGDPRRFALAQIETLNLALRNTGTKNIRVVLAGVSTTPVDHLINTENLARVKEVFPNYPKADLTTSFVASTITDKLGTAYRYGRYSMVHITTTDTFAHEIGHNIGGGHCPQNDGYEYGYSNGTYGSLLCREGTSFLAFSNPNVRAPDGTPMGDYKTADMDRTWRTNIEEKVIGRGNDSESPMLLYSMAASNECLDVLDGNMNRGALVGLWKCDPNNPNQRWYRSYFNNSVQFRLAAKPSLCLYNNPGGGSDRDVVLGDGSACQYIVWTPENQALKISGNGEYLYLYRTLDNRLRAGAGTPDPSYPGFYWDSRFISQ